MPEPHERVRKMPNAYWITEKSKLLLEAIDAKLLCLNANGALPDVEMEKFEKFWNALLLRGIVKEPCDKPGKVFGDQPEDKAKEQRP